MFSLRTAKGLREKAALYAICADKPKRISAWAYVRLYAYKLPIASSAGYFDAPMDESRGFPLLRG